MRFHEVTFEALIFAPHVLNLGPGLYDLIRERLGMQTKLSIGGKKLCLFQLKQSLRRKPRTPFLCQFIR